MLSEIADGCSLIEFWSSKPVCSGKERTFGTSVQNNLSELISIVRIVFLSSVWIDLFKIACNLGNGLLGVANEHIIMNGGDRIVCRWTPKTRHSLN
jgi:hypothetical protein